MTVTISRLYNSYPDAQAAIKRLEATGVDHGDISVLASKASRMAGTRTATPPSQAHSLIAIWMGRMIVRRPQAQAQE